MIVALLSLPFLYVLVRRPVLRRLALRNVARRPRETVLVILGSLLGTAIMTGSFVVGDTFTSSIRRGAYEQLGPIDEVVSVERPRGRRRAARSARGLPESRCRRRAPADVRERGGRDDDDTAPGRADRAAARDRLRRRAPLRWRRARDRHLGLDAEAG